MSDTFNTTSEVAPVALAMLLNELRVVGTTQTRYQSQFGNQAWDIGDSITVRKQNRILVSSGATISSIADTNEASTSLSLDYRRKAVMDFTTADLTHYAKKDFSNRFIRPAVVALANAVESVVISQMATNVNYFTGTPGTAPSAFSSLAEVQAYANELGIPQDMRYMVWSERDMATFISQSGLQNSFDKNINSNVNMKGRMGELLGFEHFRSPIMATQTAGIGDFASTPSGGFVSAGNVKTTVTSGTAIVVENLAVSKTGVFLAGDKITIAGVYSVNPLDVTVNTGELIQFTVTADADSDGSGESTIAVSPSIVSSSTSPFRNVSSTTGIAGGATSAISLATGHTGSGSATKHAYRMNIGYHPDAVLFAAPPLMIPKSIVSSAAGVATDKDTGISIRIIEDYDVTNDKTITRLDILFGVAIVPEMMVALLGGI